MSASKILYRERRGALINAKDKEVQRYPQELNDYMWSPISSKRPLTTLPYAQNRNLGLVPVESVRWQHHTCSSTTTEHY